MARKKDKQTPIAADNADAAAWQRLTASTKPLARESRNRHIATPSPHGAVPTAKDKIKTKTKSKVKGSSNADPSAPPTKPPLPSATGGTGAAPQSALLPRTRRRLARGTLPIEARLDLHGLSLAEAERALSAFVAQARGQGHVWLLVITGKGVRGEGKLRRALPEWLERGALAGQIVEYGPAAANHGGDGAFYLRVRRVRK